MSARESIIPVFVPHLGCPHNCVFCNQNRISGQLEPATPQTVTDEIENAAAFLPKGGKRQLAFYGGSFTAIPAAEQEALLGAAKTYLDRGEINAIRLSTRPDAIDETVLERLRRYGGGAVARGAGELPGHSGLPLRFPLSHDAAVRAESYRAAASAVEAELRQGRDVAMVNLGDVALFATAYYIFAEIERDGFPARMLPGVTSVAAVAARLGQSLTEMEQPLHILPASCDLDAALALPGTKVLMKSGSAIHETVAALGRAGLLERASMVADCGLPSERVFRDLREIPENVSYFATILVRSE